MTTPDPITRHSLALSRFLLALDHPAVAAEDREIEGEARESFGEIMREGKGRGVSLAGVRLGLEIGRAGR